MAPASGVVAGAVLAVLAVAVTVPCLCLTPAGGLSPAWILGHVATFLALAVGAGLLANRLLPLPPPPATSALAGPHKRVLLATSAVASIAPHGSMDSCFSRNSFGAALSASSATGTSSACAASVGAPCHPSLLPSSAPITTSCAADASSVPELAPRGFETNRLPSMLAMISEALPRSTRSMNSAAAAAAPPHIAAGTAAGLLQYATGAQSSSQPWMARSVTAGGGSASGTTGSGRGGAAAAAVHSHFRGEISTDALCTSSPPIYLSDSATAALLSGSTRSRSAFSDLAQNAGRIQVLCVDGDSISQAVMQALLWTHEYDVVTFSSGEEALQLVHESEALPDIVLLDSTLQKMSGFEACQELRAHYTACELPIIMTTCSLLEEDVINALQMGANDYLVKPIRHLELMARIKLQLQLKRSVKVAAEAKMNLGLLRSILPPVVINQLKEGHSLIAQLHQEVTILFSDIRSFTTLSSAWPTERIILMLNDMFSRFDLLCEHHGVYKVETIGDAYMIVSGHDGVVDHAPRLMRMAQDMIKAVDGMLGINDEPIQIRIGVHTGPAHSGVVGLTRPRYCFFGDTVNTASRMESTSFPMCVQVSDALYRRLHVPPAVGGMDPGELEFCHIGSRDIKGKGSMHTYLLKAGLWEAGVEWVRRKGLLVSEDFGLLGDDFLHDSTSFARNSRVGSRQNSGPDRLNQIVESRLPTDSSTSAFGPAVQHMLSHSQHGLGGLGWGSSGPGGTADWGGCVKFTDGVESPLLKDASSGNKDSTDGDREEEAEVIDTQDADDLLRCSCSAPDLVRIRHKNMKRRGFALAGPPPPPLDTANERRFGGGAASGTLVPPATRGFQVHNLGPEDSAGEGAMMTTRSFGQLVSFPVALVGEWSDADELMLASEESMLSRRASEDSGGVANAAAAVFAATPPAAADNARTSSAQVVHAAALFSIAEEAMHSSRENSSSTQEVELTAAAAAAAAGLPSSLSEADVSACANNIRRASSCGGMTSSIGGGGGGGGGGRIHRSHSTSAERTAEVVDDGGLHRWGSGGGGGGAGGGLHRSHSTLADFAADLSDSVDHRQGGRGGQGGGSGGGLQRSSSVSVGLAATAMRMLSAGFTLSPRRSHVAVVDTASTGNMGHGGAARSATAGSTAAAASQGAGGGGTAADLRAGIQGLRSGERPLAAASPGVHSTGHASHSLTPGLPPGLSAPPGARCSIDVGAPVKRCSVDVPASRVSFNPSGGAGGLRRLAMSPKERAAKDHRSVAALAALTAYAVEHQQRGSGTTAGQQQQGFDTGSVVAHLESRSVLLTSVREATSSSHPSSDPLMWYKEDDIDSRPVATLRTASCGPPTAVHHPAAVASASAQPGGSRGELRREDYNAYMQGASPRRHYEGVESPVADREAAGQLSATPPALSDIVAGAASLGFITAPPHKDNSLNTLRNTSSNALHHINTSASTLLHFSNITPPNASTAVATTPPHKHHNTNSFNTTAPSNASSAVARSVSHDVPMYRTPSRFGGSVGSTGGSSTSGWAEQGQSLSRGSSSGGILELASGLVDDGRVMTHTPEQAWRNSQQDQRNTAEGTGISSTGSGGGGTGVMTRGGGGLPVAAGGGDGTAATHVADVIRRGMLFHDDTADVMLAMLSGRGSSTVRPPSVPVVASASASRTRAFFAAPASGSASCSVSAAASTAPSVMRPGTSLTQILERDLNSDTSEERISTDKNNNASSNSAAAAPPGSSIAAFPPGNSIAAPPLSCFPLPPAQPLAGRANTPSWRAGRLEPYRSAGDGVLSSDLEGEESGGSGVSLDVANVARRSQSRSSPYQGLLEAAEAAHKSSGDASPRVSAYDVMRQSQQLRGSGPLTFGSSMSIQRTQSRKALSISRSEGGTAAGGQRVAAATAGGGSSSAGRTARQQPAGSESFEAREP